MSTLGLRRTKPGKNYFRWSEGLEVVSPLHTKLQNQSGGVKPEAIKGRNLAQLIKSQSDMFILQLYYRIYRKCTMASTKTEAW